MNPTQSNNTTITRLIQLFFVALLLVTSLTTTGCDSVDSNAVEDEPQTVETRFMRMPPEPFQFWASRHKAGKEWGLYAYPVDNRKPVKLLPTVDDGDQPLRTVGELRSFISNLDDSMLLCGTSMSGYNSVFPIRAKARTTPPPGVRGWASNPYVSFTGYASPGSPNRYSDDWKALVQDEPTA